MDFEIFNNHLIKYNGHDDHVIIPSEVTAIDDYAFYDNDLKSISIPTSVTEMGDNIFYDCTNLESVTIPDSVSYLGEAVFSRCSNLKSVKLSNKLFSLNKILFYQCFSLVEVTLPSNLTSIERGCFNQCHSLKRLQLPDSIKKIGDNAFDDCISLKEINTPKSLIELGNNVFFNCLKLEQFVCNEQLEKIGKGCFETRGIFSLVSNKTMMIHSSYLDNNWNMNWNFGHNNQFNGKNEENYQLYYSYLPIVDFNEFKPQAVIVLLVNFLETYKMHDENSISLYTYAFVDHKAECLEFMIRNERYKALEHALDNHLCVSNDLEPFFNLIKDQEEKAKLMEYNKDNTNSIDDLLNLL